jgi:hypothetical protein
MQTKNNNWRWSFTLFFFWAKRKLQKFIPFTAGKWQGEMLFAVWIKGEDYEGRSPADIRIYFDGGIELEQMRRVSEEVAGAFLAMKKQREAEEKRREQDRERDEWKYGI